VDVFFFCFFKYSIVDIHHSFFFLIKTKIIFVFSRANTAGRRIIVIIIPMKYHWPHASTYRCEINRVIDSIDRPTYYRYLHGHTFSAPTSLLCEASSIYIYIYFRSPYNILRLCEVTVASGETVPYIHTNTALRCGNIYLSVTKYTNTHEIGRRSNFKTSSYTLIYTRLDAYETSFKQCTNITGHDREGCAICVHNYLGATAHTHANVAHIIILTSRCCW